MDSIKKNIKKYLKLNLKSIDNMKNLYRLIFNTPIPSNPKDLAALERAIECYEKINSNLQKTIDARKNTLETIKRKTVREERV